MKKKVIKAVRMTLCCMLSFAMLLSVKWAPVHAEEISSENPLPEQAIGNDWKKADGEAAKLGYTYLAIENEREAFYINEDGNFGILDKKTGKWFLSIPSEEDREEDPIARAVNKMRLGSDYQIVFIDQNGATSAKNTLTGAVNDGNVRLTAAEGGVKVWYYVEDTGVTFSVLYQLTEDGFTVTIPFEDFMEPIWEGRTAADKEYVSYWGIRDISVLPYFKAAGPEEEGYILIPDGSGALINFNNQKSSYGAYSQEVYGRDPALPLTQVGATVKNVTLPVFGASFGDHGYFAIAEKGAASATINAMTSGNETSYNNAYITFRYRQTMTASRSVASAYGTNNTLGTNVVVDNNAEIPFYRLRYCLLDEDSADYVGMAGRYRDYLASNGLVRKDAANDSPLYLTLYGGIEDTDYFLGIPYKTVTELTSYENAKEILEELRLGGVDQMAVRYCGWQKDGLEAEIPTKIKFESKLGGKNDFYTLVDYGNNNGIKVFPDFDYMNLYQSGNGYSIHKDAVLAATNDTSYQYTYDLNTGMKQDTHRWQLLTPKLSLEAFTKLISGKEKTDMNNISLGSVGSSIYSDFNTRSAVHRDDTVSLWTAMVQEATDNFEGVMVETGNIYAAMYADYIINVTSESTHFDLADDSVPFYQILFHGYASYGTEPINLTADPDKAFLKALETGSNLNFSLIYGDTYELVETRYNFLYNAGFQDWQDTIQEYYSAAKPVLSAVAGSEITGHIQVADNVYRTEYGKAGVVYVNYGKKDVTVDGITVTAGGYVFLEGGRS